MPQNNGNRKQMSNEELRREHRAERRRRQRMRRHIFYMVLSLFVIGIGIVLSLTVFFNITEIHVNGDSIYTNKEIVASSGIQVGDNLFLVSRNAARNSITEELPFVGTVEFSTRLPGSITLNVAPTYVRCAVETEKGYVLIDNQGKVLDNVATLEEIYDVAVYLDTLGNIIEEPEAEEKIVKYVLGSENIIIIKGVAVKESIAGKELEVADERTMDIYQQLMTAFENNDIKGVNEIDITDAFSVKFMYQNRIEVLVGSVSNLENKLALCKEVLKNQDEISTYQTGTVDLTIDKKAYFSPSSEQTTAPVEESTTEATSEKTTEKD